jgi:DNA-binding winged helix-turn-helix (wHTH) protein
MPPSQSRKTYRFGSFTVDPDAGEVRKNGARVRVQDQPLLLLSALLERPGVLVTREELHRRLWPDDTFVDFDNGLNAAAGRLRQALGDSAQTPRYIESVPRRGYRFIAAVETEFADSDAGVNGVPEVPANRLKSVRREVSWIAAGLLFLTAAVLSWVHFREQPRTIAPFEFSLAPPDGTTFGLFDSAEVSPDGRLIAFSAIDDAGERRLWLRPLDSLSARRLDDTNGAAFPFWSSDSRNIGFFGNGKLERINAAGGPARIICDAADGRGASWNRQGMIVFTPGLTSPLFQVPAAGGEPKQVTTLNRSRQEISHRWPYFLPGGDRFLYTARTTKVEDSAVFVGSLRDGRSSLLVPSLINAVYAGDGRGGLPVIRERAQHHGTAVRR